ncbi:ribosomal RNA large subunit methyltransferase E [mine drainage metagenome]|uniref:Ribosomal RNA large subunit methyltransferase E n=1 Tax=mine drainage metagenome TaxID=410659 RepID=A0A1J5PKR0_9ZZZZ
MRGVHLDQVLGRELAQQLAPVLLAQSGADAELMTQLKRDFASVRHVKPASSRKDSSERYVLAMGFRGEQARAQP